MQFKTVEDIRKALIERNPDVNDYEWAIEHSGFAHDNPIMATAIVLVSSVVLRTTNPGELAQFTKYSVGFTNAIAINMKNNRLRKNNQYDCSSWFSGSLIPSADAEIYAVWEHVEIAVGNTWYPHANINFHPTQ